MSANTETTMSPAELFGTLDDAGGSIANAQREGITTTVSYDQIVKARTAVSALIEREAALVARNAELERLCDATYVAKGADAYNHACETMEAWQKARAKSEKDAGCEGSLCDGLSWLHSRVDSLEAERDALAERHAATERDACLQAERANELAERVKALENAIKSFPEEPNPYMYRMAQARARAALAACKPSS